MMTITVFLDDLAIAQCIESLEVPEDSNSHSSIPSPSHFQNRTVSFVEVDSRECCTEQGRAPKQIVDDNSDGRFVRSIVEHVDEVVQNKVQIVGAVHVSPSAVDANRLDKALHKFNDSSAANQTQRDGVPWKLGDVAQLCIRDEDGEGMDLKFPADATFDKFFKLWAKYWLEPHGHQLSNYDFCVDGLALDPGGTLLSTQLRGKAKQRKKISVTVVQKQGCA